MKASIRLGSIAGVEVGLHYSWFLVVVLVSWSLSVSFLPDRYPGWSEPTYWIAGVASALLLFVSVLVHEMAHSLVARARGFPVSGITLFVLGGVSNLKADARKASDEFVIATVGPLTSFVLAAVLWLVWLVVGDGKSPVDAILFYLAFINALLGAFNMLPAFPLDGGRVLRSAIWALTGSHTKATRISSLAGQIVGIGMMVLGVVQFLWGGSFISGIWLALLGWFLPERGWAHPDRGRRGGGRLRGQGEGRDGPRRPDHRPGGEHPRCGIRFASASWDEGAAGMRRRHGRRAAVADRREAAPARAVAAPNSAVGDECGAPGHSGARPGPGPRDGSASGQRDTPASRNRGWKAAGNDKQVSRHAVPLLRQGAGNLAQVRG